MSKLASNLVRSPILSICGKYCAASNPAPWFVSQVRLLLLRPRPSSHHRDAAIDQQVEKFRQDNGREPTEDEVQKIREWTLSTVRGTVMTPAGEPGLVLLLRRDGLSWRLAGVEGHAATGAAV